MRRPDLQLVTYRLTPNAPVEKLCQGRMLLNLRKKPEVEEVFWGRWTEDESCLDILIKWEGDFSAEKTLRYLSPLNAYLRADCLPLSVTFETYGDLRVLATHGDIAYLTITTFRIPASVYAADLEIDRRIGEVVRSLVFGAPRHGSNWIPPPEDEIPLDYRIGAATRDWTGALVHSEPSPSSSKEKSSNISADKRWVAFVQWKRPHLETEFKMRGGRHFFIKLAKLKGIRGLDGEDPSENAEILAEKDTALATKGFWRPITETWDATLEEHHVAFHQIDKYCMDSNIWFQCTIQ